MSNFTALLEKAAKTGESDARRRKLGGARDGTVGVVTLHAADGSVNARNAGSLPYRHDSAQVYLFFVGTRFRARCSASKIVHIDYPIELITHRVRPQRLKGAFVLAQGFIAVMVRYVCHRMLD